MGQGGPSHAAGEQVEELRVLRVFAVRPEDLVVPGADPPPQITFRGFEHAPQLLMRARRKPQLGGGHEQWPLEALPHRVDGRIYPVAGAGRGRNLFQQRREARLREVGHRRNEELVARREVMQQTATGHPRPGLNLHRGPRIAVLDETLDGGVEDDEVKVVILSADGPHFSAGHDLREFAVTSGDRRGRLDGHRPVGCWGGFDLPGIEGWMAMEEETFLGLCWRWRNLPKPTIAQVQGRAIAGGLMLVWVCDLIVAATDAEFSDPVVAFGVNGHEFFVHPWEVGPRRAKEMLFTGDAITAEDARRLGMVNHVVDAGRLSQFTLGLAERIARQPSMGLKLAKQSVNQALDAQGQWTALQSALSLHEIGHAHNMALYDLPVHPDGAKLIRDGHR